MSTVRSSARWSRPAWLLAALLLGLLAPARALAAEFRQGDTVTIGPGEVINEDLYVFGNNVEIQGTVHGDLLSFARRVDITGTVDGDVLAAAADLNVSGQVRGSIRGAAGTVVVGGHVGEDSLLAGGEVRLEPSARVGRDAFLASSTADVQAPVGGDLRAAVDKLTLAAPVSGSVHAEVGTLRLTDRAQVAGGISYRSAKGAEIDSGATVTGPIQRLSPEPSRHPGPMMYMVRWLRSLVGLFALGLLLVLITPDFARRVPVTLRQQPLRSLGWGALALVGAPIFAGAFFALGMLIGGWWIGLLALGVYALAVALCFPIVGMFIGRWLLDHFGKAGTHLVLALLLGLVLLTVVDRVPILGALIVLATVLFGLGALVLTAAHGRRPLRGPAQPLHA